ncbi:PPE family protein [Candidatus Mycobacterium methanotrophicum]|uniref:PPE family protein n=1 Tax=Candidatus Mycobacterium methanotrophicum TaxID=2943498 RepID=A0ABY4QJK5_9MYCO|nr:PPE family protein [Candidatus Mycobacterium methanotrophicum]UQX10011.1 PPE family protein [Candidatus Mycobacterium methanotrophicum]
MSFMMFPPEVNSALMYSGAGSGPLMAAASAWNELATDLETTANSYQSVIQQVTSGPWLGPTSARMASATAPYIAWLQGSSIQAAQTSAQASLAAAAYEGAFAATVPPSVIAANRALLAALVATNFLGQNTPAIAATEAHYMEMWFQDGLTMDTYALTSQQATALPEQSPAPPTSDGGTSANAAAAAQSASTTGNLATGLENLLIDYLTSNSGNLTTDWTNVLGGVGVPSSWDSTLLSTLVPPASEAAISSAEGTILPAQLSYYVAMGGSMPAKMLISMSNSLSASQALQAGQQAMLAQVTQVIDGKMKALMGGIAGEMRGFSSSISAQLASASRLGGLSIPNGWAHNAPQMAVRAAPVLPQTSVSPMNPSAGLPNSPFTQALMGSLSGRGVGTQAVKTASVKVETRTPAGG